MTKIQKILYSHQDEKYGDFISKLVPTLPREKFIGVRSPEFKKIIKEVHAQAEDEIDSFMNKLPHKFQEENTLHVVLICEIKDYDKCLASLEHFLPYVDNWAISDGINPKVFDKNHDKIIKKIPEWLEDEKPYTKRVAMFFLMKYFLGDDFKTEYLSWAAKIRSDEYYVNMMTAWLFAEALTKQWDVAIEFIKSQQLDHWTHNKTIQKARESFRITKEQKDYLKTLVIKTKKGVAEN